MEYTLFYPTPWDRVDPENDNIDVCMTFPDGCCYTLVVSTPENLKALMKQDGKPYLSPAARMLIAERLTEEVVSQLIAELAENHGLLSFYGSDITETTEDIS